MNGKFAQKIQKLLWHIRWMLLVIIIVLNIFAYLYTLSLPLVLMGNGVSFAVYLFLAQIEGYFDCQANCKL